MEYTVEDVEKIYEESCRVIYETAMNGDYKRGNREAKKLEKIFKLMEKDSAWAHKCIDKLIENENVVVKTKMAAYCLALGYKVEEAVDVLEKISSDHSYGIFAFNAEMTLKVWRKNGYLRIYQK